MISSYNLKIISPILGKENRSASIFLPSSLPFFFFLERERIKKSTFFLTEVNLLVSYTRLHRPTFRQRYPTTNAQDKSSSVMVGRHF